MTFVIQGVIFEDFWLAKLIAEWLPPSGEEGENSNDNTNDFLPEFRWFTEVPSVGLFSRPGDKDQESLEWDRDQRFWGGFWGTNKNPPQN